MKTLKELKNFEHGSIVSHWFLKKMNWTPTNGEVLVLEGDEDKSLHKKNLVKAKRIIDDFLSRITLYHMCLP